MNEGACPQGARGAGPNRGNKGVSFKDYSTRMIQQNVTIFVMNRHLGKENLFCIN